MSPTERLVAAANTVSTARSLRLKGTFSSGSDSLQGDMLVTKGGRATGQVTWDGSSVTVLSADDKLFVKAPKSYWQGKLTSTASDRFLDDGEQWGRVRDTELSVKFHEDLTPSALASELRQLSNRYSLTDTETTVRGRQAIKISSGLTSFYVSDDDEAEVLRYESSSLPRVTADVTVQSTSASSSSIGQLRTAMGELTDSFDSSQNPSIRGKPEFVSCDDFGDPCTVRAKAWSTRGGEPSVPIKVHFLLTADQGGGGRKYGECEATGTVTGISDVSVQCTISGGDWARYGKSDKQVWVSAAAMTMGATDSDVQTLQRGLESE
jgi:hypothetical protein